MYSVTDLGVGGYDSSSQGRDYYALNDLGQVIGTTVTSDGSGRDQFIYSNGSTTNFGSGVTFMYTNASGQMVERLNGDSANSQPQGYVFREADGSTHAIGGLTANDTPVGIDNTGNVYVTTSAGGPAQTSLSVLRADGTRETIASGYTSLGVTAVGPSGQIAGLAESTTPFGIVYQSFAHSSGQNGISLQGPSQVLDQEHVTTAFNNKGSFINGSQVYNSLDGQYNKSTSTLLPLSSIPMGSIFSAMGLNDAGVVVGHQYNVFTYGRRGGDALILMNNTIADVNDLIPSSSKLNLFDAAAINNSGQILAFGTDDADGKSHIYLLNPSPASVPEPSTWLVFGCVAVFGYLRVRRGLSISPATSR